MDCADRKNSCILLPFCLALGEFQQMKIYLLSLKEWHFYLVTCYFHN